METSKEHMRELLKSYRWSVTLSTADASDIEDILNFVHDVFEMEANAIREKCPHATNSIDNCETVVRQISFFTDDIIELFEQAKED